MAEAEAVAAVRHPNVVQVYEFGDHNGRPYLAMEYLPHPFSREAKPSAEAARTMSKIGRGVGAAHDLGIGLICFKCLSKDPAERYPTANELASDLEKFAAGETVSVRAAKWVRRKPTAAAAWAAGLTSVLLLIVAASLLYAYIQTRDQRNLMFVNLTAAFEAEMRAEGVPPDFGTCNRL